MGGPHALVVSCLLFAASRGLGRSSYVQALSSDVVPATHFEPQVAMLCDGGKANYHNQYMTETGRWVTDLDTKATCRRDKVEILDYCKGVYPKRDITNIVESNHYIKIQNWCKIGHKKCKGARWVKPYRCLEGPFQSDALLVPEHCLFDHIHNQTKCWEFDQWNQTAGKACQERDMVLNSFAMLLPCGIDVFSGVEFVCCPKHYKDMKSPKSDLDLVKEEKVKLEVPQPLESESTDDGEDEDDDPDEEMLDDAADASESDEDDDEDDDEEETDKPTNSSPKASASSTQAPQENHSASSSSHAPDMPTPDPYFTHFDPRIEHQAFKEAEQRLEEMHKEKITKVMKDWSDLEERYQEMRNTDTKAAEEFKKKMTLRFQKTVQALEEEGNAEKRQLVAMHQQRVMAHINERKKEAMTCYTEALNENPPNAHRVQKCLQKLLRALHKDRHHTVAHYRHLLNTNFEQAERERDLTLEHLVDIDKMVNQSLQMLSSRFPELSAKIRQLMEDYATALRSKDDTPGSLLARTRESETHLLDRFRAEVTARMQEKERQRQMERERKAQRQRERAELREEQKRVEHNLKGKDLGRQFDPESMEDEATGQAANEHVAKVDTGVPQPKVAHAQAHSISHEASYSVHREVYHRENKSIYFTLAFAGIALMAAMIVGIVVLRRRHSRSPQNQGFVEVDQAATPEERHVANMQINGYENPTYKYFEAKD